MTDALLLPWERDDTRAPLGLRIAASTARAIVEDAQPAGSLLTEVERAEASGASRTPAREAMLQLEAWGLVRLLPKKGAIVTVVTVVTPDERRDMLDFRTMIETDAVAALSRDGRSPDEVAAALQRTLDRQGRAAADHDDLAFAGADYAFHASVIHAGGNAVVAGLLAGLGPRIARLTYMAITESPDLTPRLHDEHLELGRLARLGDARLRVAAEGAHRRRPPAHTGCRASPASREPDRNSVSAPRADSGSTCATYWSGRTTTMAPSEEMPRTSKTSTSASAAQTFSQSWTPSTPVVGSRISGSAVTSIP